MGSCVFPVYVKKSEVVTAVLPMHEHWLPMSNLDLLLPPLDVGVFFCYKKENTDLELNFTPETMVTAIKSALAQALVSFYPLAGEIMQNRLGEPVLLCNNRGVDFVHAYAETELKELDLHHPDTSVQGKLVPAKKQGVLSVQVTELKCGGLVIGCTFDHRATDAHSANHFFTAWAEIAQAKTTTYTPILSRSIFNPRNPPQYDSSIDNMYVLISSLPPPKEPKACDDELRSRIYYIKVEEIDLLRSEASYDGCRRTKLESFSSFLWKTLAEGEWEEDMKFKLGIVVDGRQRLKSKDDRTLSMYEYFGNVISIPYSEASVGELKAMQLKGVANLVHECIESAAKEEHFLGLIDWVELQRPEPAMAKIYCKNSEDEEAIVVSSGLRFPVSQIDFGWGMPQFGSYHFPWGSQTGYVMPMPSTRRKGDWVVYMHLKNRHLDLVEKQAAHVFRRLSSSYLNVNGDLMELKT